jgi:23S rRNA pseudouridine1911/1915/1917 synthase
MIRFELRLIVSQTQGTAQGAEARIDRALTDALKLRAPHLSRATLKAYFQRREILLNGRAVPPATVVAPGEHTITILNWEEGAHREAPHASPSTKGPFLPVIFEDERLLVLDKESGTPSVPHAADETETAVGSALALRPELRDVGFGGLEPGLLHRLDTGTSGLLAFAKTTAEFHRLREAWQSGKVRKTYRARASGHGEFPALPAELRWLLAHDEKSAKKMIAFPDGIRSGSRYRGKPLETITRLIRLHGPAQGTAASALADLELEIETGVMHQIRCTLAALHWPILGDFIYGGPASSRLWLHAWKLELPTANGSPLKLEAPLPLHWRP